MQSNQLQKIDKDFDLEPSEPVMYGLFRQYERVLIESLVTSFALDFLVKDQHGGDVDTIHNVRKIGQDDKMTYKNVLNQQNYERRETYDSSRYHKDDRYIAKGREVKAQKEAGILVDAYTGERVARNANVDIDHVISAKEIADDKGRVLSGLEGVDLANSEDNLQPTDRSINRSMKERSIDEYCAWLQMTDPTRAAELEKLRGKPQSELTDKERAKLHKYEQQAAVDQERIKRCDSTARRAYEAKLKQAYYTSPQFAKDVASAASNVGIRMGVRQAAGFMFAEMWFAVKEEFQNSDQEADFDMKDFLDRIGRGLKRGCENAKEKYADLFSRCLNGVAAGALSSITTTLCNIFFTTAKNIVRIIRQAYPSLVEAAKVLFINPECYTFGERMRAVAKVLATGASVVTGVVVSDAISKTQIVAIPVLGDVVPAFCGAFVTGIMSCTFLYFLDRNPVVNQLIRKLDGLHTIETEVNYYRQQAKFFQRYAAELMEIDLEEFKRETSLYSNAVAKLEGATTENELNSILKSIYVELNMMIPWGDNASFGEFMEDKSAHLVFE